MEESSEQRLRLAVQERIEPMKVEHINKIAAKDTEIEELRVLNNEQKQQIHDLEITADTDGEAAQTNSRMLSGAQMALSQAKAQINNQRQEIRRLNQWGKLSHWRKCGSGYRRSRSDMDTLADQRLEPIWAQAKNEGLQKDAGAHRDKNGKVSGAGKNGDHGRAMASQSNHENTHPDGVAESLVKALTAANARADALQISVDTLKAEKEFQYQLVRNAASIRNP